MMDHVIHLLILLLLPPLLLGVITKTKAWFAGRRGPSVFQPYYDLLRLWRRGMVFSTTTTWVFRLGPIVTLAAALLAGLLVPFGGTSAPIRFSGDLILFAYLFALGRFFTTAAALDTGSAFEGMGSAREVTFACLAEPALFLALMVLARLSGSLSLGTMLHATTGGVPAEIVAPLVLVAIGLFIVLLAETCRIPVDDPTTHLELTMIHEAMVLDHSGPLFGAILYGSAVKLLVLGALLYHVVVPAYFGNALDWLVFLAGMLGLAVVIGIVESIMARLPMHKVPVLLVGAVLFCGLGFILMIR
ncbi:MAG: respiratory chain complex I subunit 1 family protein [Kiritimatiellia bacterium]|jgi:formate hydrogenlyase subunit 4